MPDAAHERALCRLRSANEAQSVHLLGKTLRAQQQAIAQLQAQMDDYENYVELWAHEVKTPLALLTLVLDNRRDTLPAAVGFKLDMNDLKIDTYRSSGAGGQHVNKTESAIRITHLPTGTVVECQDERSQYKNKDRAMQILRSKLYVAVQAKQAAAVAAERKSQIGSGDRSERVRTYNFPQNRVTDHRLTGDNKNFNIAAIMNGNLDPLIDALVTADQAEKLRAQSEA